MQLYNEIPIIPGETSWISSTIKIKDKHDITANILLNISK